MRLELPNPLRLQPGQSADPAAQNVLMLRSMGFLFLAGAVLGGIWLVLPHAEDASESAIWILIGLAAGAGAGMAAGAGRLPAHTPLAGDLIGMLMIGLAVHWAGDSHSVFSMMFVWVAAYNAYFFRPSAAGLQLAFLGLVYAIALASVHEAGTGWLSQWLVTMVALGVTSWLISWVVRARRDAEREREHLAALVAGSGEAILGKSLDGTILSWNRGAEALYGYSAEEIIGAPISRLVPEGYDDSARLLERVRRGERILDHETVRLRKDGSMVAVSLTISPVHDSAGRVAGASAVARDISRHKELEVQRERLLAQSRLEALTDPLTGLANRRSWDRELRRALARATREEHAVCVALVDLDHFKEYNDRHGHLAGDQLLREAADTWSTLLRDEDMIARYGGEEFAVLLPNCSAEHGHEIIERLRSSTPLGETSSAGLTDWCLGDSVEDLTARADSALYRAKRGGRNRLVAIPSPSSERTTEGDLSA
jgi:diguanylate cyclase (GGDEF)-like protein/PAS domain S-box-containing protein